MRMPPSAYRVTVATLPRSGIEVLPHPMSDRANTAGKERTRRWLRAGTRNVLLRTYTRRQPAGQESGRIPPEWLHRESIPAAVRFLPGRQDHKGVVRHARVTRRPPSAYETPAATGCGTSNPSSDVDGCRPSGARTARRDR